MHLHIDYDQARDKGIIKSNFLSNLREAFSEEDTTVRRKRFVTNNRYIPDRKYVITQQGRFDVGLLEEILKYIKALNVPFQFTYSEEFANRYSASYRDIGSNYCKLKLECRDYQLEGLKRGLSIGNGIFLYPTGSGKTLLMAYLVSTVLLNRPTNKTLIITLPHLVNQTYNDFLNYGVPSDSISRWDGDNPLNMNSKIVICSMNILYSRIDNLPLEIKKAKIASLGLQKSLQEEVYTPEQRRKTEKDIVEIEKALVTLNRRQLENEAYHGYLSSINLLLVDEVHTLKKTNEISEITKFVTTRNRYGFTGTLPESLIDQWNLIGIFGPIVFKVPRQYLVENKFITDVDIRILLIDYNDEPDYFNDLKSDDTDDTEETETAYEKELTFIQTNSFRNNIIKTICEKVNNNILIIVDRLNHGETLLTQLTIRIPNKKVYFIKGEVEEDVRQKVKELMEQENNIICVAMSKIFSTGINIVNLHHIMFASAGKAKVKLIQSIGRGVRMMDGKDCVTVYDLADNLRYGSRHLNRRIQVYEEEQLGYKLTPIKEKRTL